MSIEGMIPLLAGVAIAGLSVWAVERLAEQRSLRDRNLDAIDQTVRHLVAVISDAGATVAGEGATKPGRFDADAFPKADARLVGDLGALRTFYGVLAELHARAPGSRIRESDTRSIANAVHQVRQAVAAQEKRLLERKPIRTLTSQELGEFGTLLQGVTTAIRQSALADHALQGDHEAASPGPF